MNGEMALSYMDLNVDKAIIILKEDINDFMAEFLKVENSTITLYSVKIPQKQVDELRQDKKG